MPGVFQKPVLSTADLSVLPTLTLGVMAFRGVYVSRMMERPSGANVELLELNGRRLAEGKGILRDSGRGGGQRARQRCGQGREPGPRALR